MQLYNSKDEILKIYSYDYQTMPIKPLYSSFPQGTSTISYWIGRKAEGLEKSEGNKGAYKEKGPHYSTFCKAEWKGLQQCDLYSISNMNTQPVF